MIENNEENREKLSRRVVDSWNMSKLISHAIDTRSEFYKGENDEFEEDWEIMFGKEKEEQDEI